MSDYKELLLGCGSRRIKHLMINDQKDWHDLTTVDYNDKHQPDLVWDLRVTPWPFMGDSFDEIHAYEVMEHLGPQGDYMSFFTQFAEIYRILKPGGHFMATCPSRHSEWAWGDPSHTRLIQPETLIFLNQPTYTRAVGTTAMSDFRDVFTGDFDVVFDKDDKQTHAFVLKAIKPSRLSYAKLEEDAA